MEGAAVVISFIRTSGILEELYKISRNSGKLSLFAPLHTIRQTVFSDRERLILKICEMEYSLHNPYCSICNSHNIQAQILPLFLKGLDVQMVNLNFKYEKNRKDANHSD